MLDLEPADFATPRRERPRMKLCSSCRCILVRETSSCCDNQRLIPFLDMRPLLLSRETRHAILDMIDEGADSLTEDLLGEASSYLVFDYLPFLTRVLQESEVAERYRSMGRNQAYRETYWDHDQILAALRELILPPSAQ